VSPRTSFRRCGPILTRWSQRFDDGQVLAFEVKANERVAGADLKGLRTLRDALGERFIAGVALSTGLRSFTYEDRIHIMPVDRLWTPMDPPRP
jgi:hypothetical protein